MHETGRASWSRDTIYLHTNIHYTSCTGKLHTRCCQKPDDFTCICFTQEYYHQHTLSVHRHRHYYNNYNQHNHQHYSHSCCCCYYYYWTVCNPGKLWRKNLAKCRERNSLHQKVGITSTTTIIIRTFLACHNVATSNKGGQQMNLKRTVVVANVIRHDFNL